MSLAPITIETTNKYGTKLTVDGVDVSRHTGSFTLDVSADGGRVLRLTQFVAVESVTIDAEVLYTLSLGGHSAGPVADLAAGLRLLADTVERA